jgi:uncharacterized protein YPO0396
MPMLELTKIFLYNWHRFRCATIQVRDGLYLTGLNTSGKSTVLDALQVIFLADLDLIKFNSSAQERSARTLGGYVRGKMLERWLRFGGAIGYIAVEFTEHPGKEKITLGCCIEAAEKYGSQGRRLYFILREPLDPTIFLPEGQPLSQSVLKKMLRDQRSTTGRYYDIIGEYQEDMLDILGRLNKRFFDLFRRAMSFGRIKDVGNFIEQWLLPEYPLDLHDLQKVVQRLETLQQEAREVKEKLALLETIVEKRTGFFQWKGQQETYEVLLAMLLHEDTLRSRQKLEDERANLSAQLEGLTQRQTQLQRAINSHREQQRELQKTLYSLDVVKRKQELRDEIQRLAQELQAALERKKQSIQEWQELAEKVRSLPESGLLEEEEGNIVRQFLAISTEVRQDQPLPANLKQQCADMSTALSSAWRRAVQETATLNGTCKQLRERAAKIAQELQELERSGRRPHFDQIEPLREALTPLVGSRPAILCEQLEIPDERWQTAVEAMLDWRRYLLLVQPHAYEEVVRFLEQTEGNQRFYNIGVLDVERAYQQRRPALERSLALQVETSDPYLRAYIDSILGTIITCASASELRRYQRAITANLIYYSEWSVRRLSPQRYQPWMIGRRAQRSQIEARQRELDEIGQHLAALNASLTRAKYNEQRLDLKQRFDRLQDRLAQPSDDQQLARDLASVKADLESLDLSYADELERQIDQLETFIRADEEKEREIAREIGTTTSDLKHLNAELVTSEATIRQRERERDECKSKYDSERAREAERLFVQHCQEPDLTQILSNIERAMKNYTTRVANQLKEFHDLGLKYNMKYQFAGLPDVPEDMRYVEEYRRLADTTLPAYQNEIDQAREEALQELREHVLHLLRERIENAKQELKRMNDALRLIHFHGDRFRFLWEIAKGREEYYHLIEDSQIIGIGPLFESEFYQQHRETFERFYAEVIDQSQDAHPRESKNPLTDYRTYLEYDIEIDRNGEKSRLSRVLGEQSGGETQTPFYVAIAASFVQLYRINVGGMQARPGRNESPTIRLAVFDEAFNQMDQDRIGATLDLLHSYGLQIITATPLERCEYLVPKMCTSLVLTAVGDDVLIEEYRNYAARLQELLEES